MAKQPPNDYKDPYWTNLSTIMEKKHGLPAGLLVNIVQKGERTNNNLVSPVGAKTVYQIMPSTRKLFLNKYGVDAYSSPEGAAEMAALHLKESLGKKGATTETAIREYHGGPNRKGWGPINNDYYGRVSGGMSGKASTVPQQKQRLSFQDAEARVGRASVPNRRDSQAEIQSLLSAYDKSVGKSTAVQTPKKVSVDDLVKAFDQNKENNMTQKERDFRNLDYVENPTPTQKEELSLGQQLVGAGEAAVTLGTGLVGGIVGAAGGALAGAGREMLAGEFGTPEAAERIAQTSGAGAKALTYEPRSQGGQRAVQALGEMAEDTGLTTLPPVLGAGLGTATATLGRANLPAVAVGADKVIQTAKPVVTGAVDAVKSGAAKAKDMMPSFGRGNRDSNSGLDHMGAAAVPDADIRRQLFEELDVPSTAAQLSRDQTDLAELYNTARRGGEAGTIVQKKLDEQQAALASTVDDIIESKDARTIDRHEIGVDIKEVLNNQYKVESAAQNKAYEAVRNSASAKSQVDVDAKPVWSQEHIQREAQAGRTPDASRSLLDIINEESHFGTSDVYGKAKQMAFKMGIASQDINGNLMPKVTGLKPTINQVENFRQRINQLGESTKAGDVQAVTVLKSVLDNVLDNSGNNAYKGARKKYADFKATWANKAIIKDLIATKSRADRGDQKVINEKIIDRIVSPNTSKADLEFIEKQITKTDAGKASWNDLQTSVLDKIRNEAYSGAHNTAGEATLSFNKMDKIITKLDGDTRKLDTILGYEHAQKMRDARDLARIIQTVPPNTGVNWSNTAIALSAMADSVIIGMTGMPIAAASILRYVISKVKDKRHIARANQLVKNLNQNSGGF